MITGMQQIADKTKSLTKHNFSQHAALYTGAQCKDAFVHRKDTWKTRLDEYPLKKWPVFCFGALSILSADLVPKIAHSCPYHCVGNTTIANFSFNSTCFYKFEDVFFGSCLATFKDLFVREISKNLGKWSLKYANFRKRKSNDFFMVHTEMNVNVTKEREIENLTANEILKKIMKTEMALVHNFFTKTNENRH